MSPPPQQGQMQPQGPQGLDLSRLSPQQAQFLMKQNPRAFMAGIQDFQKSSQPQPYQAMPTSAPQQGQPQGQLPPMPQQAPQQPQGQMTLEGAVQTLQSQGLQGEDLMAGLQHLMPLLDAQSKQKAAQSQAEFNNQYKTQQLEDNRTHWKQVSEDRNASTEERAQAARNSKDRKSVV